MPYIHFKPLVLWLVEVVVLMMLMVIASLRAITHSYTALGLMILWSSSGGSLMGPLALSLTSSTSLTSLKGLCP